MPSGREVLERLESLSGIPKYRRLIRILWWYFVKNARKESRQGVMTVTEAVEKIIGENEMSMVLEMLKAEGEARGEIRATLKQRFGGVPQEIREAIQSMTDLVALESLLAHAESCKSLDEFAEALK